MSDDKWIMFKNYMHNELGITKDDIREWVREAVKEQAELLVNNTFANWSPDSVIKRVLIENNYFGNSSLNKEIVKKAAEILTEQLEIKTK